MNTRMMNVLAAIGFFVAALYVYVYDAADDSTGIVFVVLGGVFLGACFKNKWFDNLRQNNKPLWTAIIAVEIIVALGGLAALLLLSK